MRNDNKAPSSRQRPGPASSVTFSSVQARNEDKITEQDRVYCQTQQTRFTKTLDQIDHAGTPSPKEEAEQYQAERKSH
ncbi:MAG: hypothetical protein ACLR6J_12215 [Parabacteroides merdae]